MKTYIWVVTEWYDYEGCNNHVVVVKARTTIEALAIAETVAPDNVFKAMIGKDPTLVFSTNKMYVLADDITFSNME